MILPSLEMFWFLGLKELYAVTQPMQRPREKKTWPIALIQISLLPSTDQDEVESSPTVSFSLSAPR